MKYRNLERYTETEQRQIQEADRFAAEAHKGQKRKSGQPYISHPRAVASYLIELGMDADTIVAAILHDTVEDTPVTIEEIKEQFGAKVAELVDGVTKLGQIDYVDQGVTSDRRHAASVENIRKLLLAMSRDLRVLMIKLSDRRHNLTTLQHLSAENRQRIANESLEVFAPLADRLGMGVLKAEIEDLAFEYADPAAFGLVKRLVATNVAQAQDYIEELKVDVEKLLKQNEIEAVSIHGRQKHLYSVFRKLTKTQGDITKIYDLMALRVIVPTVSDCYQVLGIIHQEYKPLIYRIKDYIAVPKPNGYRSLHTTVFAKNGKIIEIQIRTVEMHKEAEHGLAAHSVYESQKGTKQYREGVQSELTGGAKRKLAWVQELASLTAQSGTTDELMDHLKVDLFQDRIFVFSPRGDLYDLPEGATPVDFAFAIHTDVGLRTQGARVNGRIAPLDKPLENRDMVEIITRKQPAPNRQWLSFVKTAGARSKIKAWFRSASHEANVATGRELIEQQLPTWGYKRLDDISATRWREVCETFNHKSLESLLAAVGEGTVALTTVLRRLLPPVEAEDRKAAPSKLKTTGRAQVVGAPDLPCLMARCCQPSPPDRLVGYITRGNGVTIHTLGCVNIPDEPDRILDCQWELSGQNSITAELNFRVKDRIGLLHDVTGIVLSRRLNIVNLTTSKMSTDPSFSDVNLVVDVPDMHILNSMIQQLKGRFELKSISVNVIRESLKTVE